MAVYHFKLSFEDNEDIYREIEIKSTQNFEDFHNIIVQSINFDNVHDASFFISDNLWHYGDEMLRFPLKEDKNNRNPDPPKRQMSKCKMVSLIDDPHQRFIYVYDSKTAWTFYVELMKIVPDDAKVTYPKCVKSIGDAPKQYKNVKEVPVVLEDEEIDDEPPTDDAAYLSAHNDDEIAELEGEEGEEEMEESAEEETSIEEDEFAEGGIEED
jgi:hypothetical protein